MGHLRNFVQFVWSMENIYAAMRVMTMRIIYYFCDSINTKLQCAQTEEFHFECLIL